MFAKGQHKPEETNTFVLKLRIVHIHKTLHDQFSTIYTNLHHTPPQQAAAGWQAQVPYSFTHRSC